MSGRPQTYLGSLEDFRVEAQAVGVELSTRHDPLEFSQLRTQGRLLAEALDLLAFDHPALRLVEMARDLNHLLQVEDLPENHKHRSLARGAVS